MTTRGTSDTRPEFDSVDLDVDTETADRVIADAVKGLARSETTEGVNYRTTDGALVAVLESRSGEADGPGATLAYRTAPATEPRTRKGRKLFEALEPHATDS